MSEFTRQESDAVQRDFIDLGIITTDLIGEIDRATAMLVDMHRDGEEMRANWACLPYHAPQAALNAMHQLELPDRAPRPTAEATPEPIDRSFAPPPRVGDLHSALRSSEDRLYALRTEYDQLALADAALLRRTTAYAAQLRRLDDLSRTIRSGMVPYLVVSGVVAVLLLLLFVV